MIRSLLAWKNKHPFEVKKPFRVIGKASEVGVPLEAFLVFAFATYRPWPVRKSNLKILLFMGTILYLYLRLTFLLILIKSVPKSSISDKIISQSSLENRIKRNVSIWSSVYGHTVHPLKIYLSVRFLQFCKVKISLLT